MELRQLRYFNRVAELGSVSKAAATLNMTQPSLSRQIMELEAELGHDLLYRTSKGVSLTPAGSGLYRHLDTVFAQIQRIPEVVWTSSQVQELVRVGVPQGMPHDWFLYLLAAVRKELPNATLSLHEATTEEQRQLLQNGLIDLAVLHLDAPELESVQVLSQRIGIAVAPDSQLALRAVLGFADLAGLRVMAHASGEINVEEARLRAACADAGVETNWVFRRFSEHSSLIAISSKVDGVLVTQTSAARHLAGWNWIPISAQVDHNESLAIRTWISWIGPVRPYLENVIKVMGVAAGHYANENVG